MRRYLKRYGSLLAGLLLVANLWGGIASASVYGRNTYNTCAYQADCPAAPTTPTPTTPTPPPTEVQLPSGLEVAINLSDGQHIPEKGYLIKITPLNGQGSSFKTADIYIDGQLVATQAPQSDGSVQWYWDPARFPGSKVTIIITDTNGKKQTFVYNVTIDKALGAGSVGITGGSSSLPAKIASAVRHTLRKLPGPVVYSLPYFIFLILLVNAVLLLLQSKRELSEKRTLDRLIAHEQAITQAKANLIELVSHYIRTPLTLIRSGVEMLKAPAVDQALIDDLQATVKSFSTSVEATVTTHLDPLMQAKTQQLETFRLFSGAAILRLWLPVVLSGGFVFAFVYLANHMTSFTASTANQITQVATFTLTTFACYQFYRRVVLHKQDKANAQRLLAEEMVVDETRDKVINEASLALQAELTKLSAVTQKLPQSNDTKFIKKGQAQLEELTNRMIIASHLKGSHSDRPYTEVTASSLFERALQRVKPKAEAAGITVQLQQDMQLATQNPDLLALVLQSLLDNAIAYSKEKGTISVTATTDAIAHSLSVIDHGAGIDATKLSQLFQPFFKAEGAEEFNHEGMGFSLYLDKIIMLYLGGDIALDSHPNDTTAAHLKWALA